MSWIADAHRDWHTVNGWDVVCPLDCGVGEGGDDYYLPEDDFVSSADLDAAASRAEDREFGRDPWV